MFSLRLWTLFFVLIAFVADVAAIVLLVTGEATATLLFLICSGAAVTAGASVLLITQPEPAVQASSESPVASPTIATEPSVPSPAARELEEPVTANGESLDNGPWLKLVEESVALLDELDHHRADFDATRQEVADHVICRLEEILERCGVEPINGDVNFDRNRHQADGAVRVLSGATVTKTLCPGFSVGKRVLRRARVRVQNPSDADSPM